MPSAEATILKVDVVPRVDSEGCSSAIGQFITSVPAVLTDNSEFRNAGRLYAKLFTDAGKK